MRVRHMLSRSCHKKTRVPQTSQGRTGQIGADTKTCHARSTSGPKVKACEPARPRTTYACQRATWHERTRYLANGVAARIKTGAPPPQAARQPQLEPQGSCRTPKHQAYPASHRSSGDPACCVNDTRVTWKAGKKSEALATRRRTANSRLQARTCTSARSSQQRATSRHPHLSEAHACGGLWGKVSCTGSSQ